MKRVVFFSLFFFCALTIYAQSRTTVRITSDISGGKNALNFHGIFESYVTSALKKAYPCLRIVTDDLIRISLMQLRQLELLGTPGEYTLEDLSANTTNLDFHVFLKVIATKDDLITMSAVFIDPVSNEDMSFCYLSGDLKELSDDQMRNAATKLAEGLRDFEICSYKGKLTIEVNSIVEKTITYQQPAPCGTEDVVTINNSREAEYTLKWELNKHVMKRAGGTVTYDLFEKLVIGHNYSCYRCKNGNQGPAVITDIIESESSFGGLSSESVVDGKNVEDARIELVFFENGTYSVLVKATSTAGILTEITEKKSEGMCTCEAEPRKSKTKEIDIPLKVVLGPYPGTSQDLILQQRESKNISDGDEKTTVKIDFLFER